MTWSTCSRQGCRAFSARQAGVKHCYECKQPLRGAEQTIEDIDLRLLERRLDLARGEVVRIKRRIAELKKVSGR